MTNVSTEEILKVFVLSSQNSTFPEADLLLTVSPLKKLFCFNLISKFGKNLSGMILAPTEFGASYDPGVVNPDGISPLIL